MILLEHISGNGDSVLLRLSDCFVPGRIIYLSSYQGGEFYEISLSPSALSGQLCITWGRIIPSQEFDDLRKLISVCTSMSEALTNSGTALILVITVVFQMNPQVKIKAKSIVFLGFANNWSGRITKI